MRSVGFSVGLPIIEGQTSSAQTDNALQKLTKKTVKQGWSAHLSHNSVVEIGVGGGVRSVIEEISASDESLHYRESHADGQIGVNCGVKLTLGAMASKGRGTVINKAGDVTGTVKTKRRLISLSAGLDLKIFKILRDYIHKIKRQTIQQGSLKTIKLETESIVRTLFSVFLAFFGLSVSDSKISMKKIRFSQKKLSQNQRLFHEAEMRCIKDSKEQIYKLAENTRAKVTQLFANYKSNKAQIIKILQNKANYEKISERSYFLSRQDSSIRFGTGKTNISPVNLNIYIDHSVKEEGIGDSTISDTSAIQEPDRSPFRQVRHEHVAASQGAAQVAQIVSSKCVVVGNSRNNHPQKYLVKKIPSLPLDFTASKRRFAPSQLKTA